MLLTLLVSVCYLYHMLSFCTSVKFIRKVSLNSLLNTVLKYKFLTKFKMLKRHEIISKPLVKYISLESSVKSEPLNKNN